MARIFEEPLVGWSITDRWEPHWLVGALPTVERSAVESAPTNEWGRRGQTSEVHPCQPKHRPTANGSSLLRLAASAGGAEKRRGNSRCPALGCDAFLLYCTKISVLSGGGSMIGVRVIFGKVASVMLTAKVLGPSLV